MKPIDAAAVVAGYHQMKRRLPHLRIERRMWSCCHFLPRALCHYHCAAAVVPVVVVTFLIVVLADEVIAVIFVDLALPDVIAIVDHVLLPGLISPALLTAPADDDVISHHFHYLPASPPQHPHSHPKNKHLNSVQTTFSHHTVHYLLI